MTTTGQWVTPGTASSSVGRRSRHDDPQVVSRDEWLVTRSKLLAHEKELTRHRDEVNAERRRLPMVEIDKDYTFAGPDGKASLPDLFAGRRQILIWHFMFDPSWDEGCEFNYDFHVTLDPAVAAVEYNYRRKPAAQDGVE
jgi:Bacterial protein of unknown function (DUF899)